MMFSVREPMSSTQTRIWNQVHVMAARTARDSFWNVPDRASCKDFPLNAGSLCSGVLLTFATRLMTDTNQGEQGHPFLLQTFC